MNIILKYIEKKSYLLFFVLEIWVIFNLFISIPGENNSLVFWILSAVAVTGFHLFIIIKIKILIKEKNLIAIPYFIIYFAIITIFFLSVVGFSLRSIEKKSGIYQNSINKNNRIYKIIQGNELAIDKYNCIINKTNDIAVVLKWRRIINELSITNTILEKMINNTNLRNEIVESDPFTLIAINTGMSKNNILFWFLFSLWALFEVGLFITAPIIIEEKVNIEINQNENLKNEIKKYIKNIKIYIDNILVNENDPRISSNDNIRKKTGLTIKECKIIRNILLKLKKENGENAIKIEPGYCGLTCNKDELLNIINELLLTNNN